MSSFQLIFTIILMFLVVANLGAMAVRNLRRRQRWNRDAELYDERGRGAPPSHEQWHGDLEAWREDYADVNAILRDLREKAPPMVVTPRLPLAKVYRDLSEDERTPKVMAYLNSRRGESVTVEFLDGKRHQGEVASVSAHNVLLRDSGGTVTSVPLVEIVALE